MQKAIANATTTAFLILGLGAIVGPAIADMGHDHGSDHSPEAVPHNNHSGDHGHHGLLEISEGQPIPQVVVDVYPDPIAGWNLHVMTENWEFAPEQVNASSIPTEGHAHLYVNGEKITRIYSEWFYLPSLPPGEHVLTVGLNANGHESLMYNGEAIEASVKVIVPE
jgi:hypothetical protein